MPVGVGHDVLVVRGVGEPPPAVTTDTGMLQYTMWSGKMQIHLYSSHIF